MPIDHTSYARYHFSFNWLIVLLIASGILTLAIAGSLIAGTVINQKLSNLVVEQSRQVTSTLARQSILPLLSQVPENAKADMDTALNYPNVKGIKIYKANGNLLVSVGQESENHSNDLNNVGEPFKAVLVKETMGEWVFVASVYDIDVDEQPESSLDELFFRTPKFIGYVKVIIDRSNLHKTQLDLLKDNISISVGIAFLLIAIAVLIVRQLTRPLYRLSGLMEQAETGKEGIRASLSGPLEVHHMARAFNTMMQSLENQHNSLLNEIKERQAIEKDLRESEDRLVSLYDNVVDGILILDDNGVIEQVNPAGEILLGKDIVGESLYEVINKSSVSNSQQIPSIKSLINQSIVEVHVSIKGKRSAGVLELDIKFSDMYLKGAQKFIAIVRNITEMQRQRKQIAGLLAQHEAIIASIPGIIYEVDKDGSLTWWNKRAEEVTGLSRVELYKKSVFEMFRDDEVNKIKDAIKQALSEGKSEVHASLYTKEGYIPYQFNSVRVRVSVEEPGTLLGVGIDDSQSINTQQLLQEARDVALESARLKSEFLANMSHEIRTPMNGMFGMLQLLADSNLSEEQRNYTDIAMRSADQLLNIINDILDFSKIESGKLNLDYKEFSIRAVIDDSVELFSQKAVGKGVNIYSNISLRVPHVIYGDAHRLYQVFSNLIGNSVKFTDTGHIMVSCEVLDKNEGADGQTTLLIEVSDTGIGIEDEAQDKVFESFIQADGSSTRKYSGTGLGLAIVKQLVELMGGEIKLKSKFGEGSTFSILLPVRVAHDYPQDYETSNVVLGDQEGVFIGDDKILLSIVRGYLPASDKQIVACPPGGLKKLGLDKKKNHILMVDSPKINEDDLKIIKTLGVSHLIQFVNQGEKVEDLVGVRNMRVCTITKPMRLKSLLDCIAKASVGATATRPRKYIEGESRAAGEAGTEALQVLVVEDNEVNQKVLKTMLDKMGFDVDVVENGKEALDVLKKQDFQIIFMDCQMPVMDGYEATKEIRKYESEEHRNRTPIIAMTGNVMKGDKEKCIESGMDDYVPKPVRLDVLKTLIARWATNNKREPH